MVPVGAFPRQRLPFADEPADEVFAREIVEVGDQDRGGGEMRLRQGEGDDLAFRVAVRRQFAGRGAANHAAAVEAGAHLGRDGLDIGLRRDEEEHAGEGAGAEPVAKPVRRVGDIGAHMRVADQGHGLGRGAGECRSARRRGALDVHGVVLPRRHGAYARPGRCGKFAVIRLRSGGTRSSPPAR